MFRFSCRCRSCWSGQLILHLIWYFNFKEGFPQFSSFATQRIQPTHTLERAQSSMRCGADFEARKTCSSSMCCNVSRRTLQTKSKSNGILGINDDRCRYIVQFMLSWKSCLFVLRFVCLLTSAARSSHLFNKPKEAAHWSYWNWNDAINSKLVVDIT